jgi:hypothetical protein
MKRLMNNIFKLLEPGNKVLFKYPINGETKEISMLLWLITKPILKRYYLRKGWLLVDDQRTLTREQDTKREALLPSEKQ